MLERKGEKTAKYTENRLKTAILKKKANLLRKILTEAAFLPNVYHVKG